MRRTLPEQMSLVPTKIDHAHARELRQMSAVLDALPEMAEAVQAALLCRGGKRIDATKGREGMTAEQVLRALIVKQMKGFSYEELSFHLSDSMTYRAFCRLGLDQKVPSKSTLQKNIKCIRAPTWETINRRLIQYAAEQGVERGDKTRTDSTVVDAMIHEPTDSSLLYDCVRVLVRQMKNAQTSFGLPFKNHRRRAKRRALGILNAKSNEERRPLYRDLLKVTEATVRSAKRITAALSPMRDDGSRPRRGALVNALRHFIRLTERVVEQTQRRVLRGESVPAAEKIVSIFEPHTDILVKDRRQTRYGHKLWLTSGASGLVTDVVVEKGNLSDCSLAVKMVRRQRKVFGKLPRQVSFDGGFSSRQNLAALKKLGVEDVAFSKGRGVSVPEMVKSSWVYRCLRRFRAGIEGTISFLKRVFGLDRCTWRGFNSFKAYVVCSVLACNLLLLARHLLCSSA